ncbi:hypothetical protein QAD02_014129 [Eretmocerus hayati]|uniref:Uncharacterized protein n=1 Tax=Eretmocerus hayati TaxID=131215 RepID=A0ACC2P7A2_9HYME|nr:hypothetical protein QAD02_014129 [Eretmocerus hayati]
MNFRKIRQQIKKLQNPELLAMLKKYDELRFEYNTLLRERKEKLELRSRELFYMYHGRKTAESILEDLRKNYELESNPALRKIEYTRWKGIAMSLFVDVQNSNYWVVTPRIEQKVRRFAKLFIGEKFSESKLESVINVVQQETLEEMEVYNKSAHRFINKLSKSLVNEEDMVLFKNHFSTHIYHKIVLLKQADDELNVRLIKLKSLNAMSKEFESKILSLWHGKCISNHMLDTIKKECAHIRKMKYLEQGYKVKKI